MVSEFLGILGIPASIGGIVWLFVQTFIVFIVIVIADRVISHGVETKHALILSFAAYFLPGLILFGLIIAGIMLPSSILLVVPLVVWVLLGELVLQGDFKSKLIVAVIAYVAFFALNASPLPSIVVSLIPL
mgnify:CR=1 FL=1